MGTPRALTRARRVTPRHLSPSLRFPRAILSRSGRGLPIPLRNVPHVRQGSVLCSPPLCPRPQAGGRRLSSTRGPTAEDPSQGRDLISPGEEVPGTYGRLLCCVPAAPAFISPAPPASSPIFQARKETRRGSNAHQPESRLAPGLGASGLGCHRAPGRSAGRGATFGGGGGRQRVHIGGLPAFHHWLAQDLQVCVRCIVGRRRRPPRGAAVLARREDGGRSGGVHTAGWTARGGIGSQHTRLVPAGPSGPGAWPGAGGCEGA